MARQPLGSVIPNLLHDSGPPLHYFLARFGSIEALRMLSLVFAAVQFVLVIRRSLLAAALLAVYPPAVLFAADARAYALCALFVTAAVIALDDGRPWVAALLLVLAAYSHYYGVLFFPVLLVRGRWSRVTGLGGSSSSDEAALETRDLRPVTRVAMLFAALVLFVPGFYLAFQQPAAALRWNREALWAPLANISFAGLYPYALFATAPVILVIVALIALLVALSGRLRAIAAAVIIPLVLVIGFHLAGRPVYFPMRFECVIAGPLALWIASAASGRIRRIAAAALMVIGAITVALGIVDHFHRPADSYRQAALALRGTTAPIVATGYLYLESVMAVNRPVIAWPAEQAQHPGWRAAAPPDPRALPSAPFIWIGERYAPEVRVLREARALRLLFVNERAIVVRAEGLTPPVH
jgi:hypothetical protein